MRQRGGTGCLGQRGQTRRVPAVILENDLDTHGRDLSGIAARRKGKRIPKWGPQDRSILRTRVPRPVRGQAALGRQRAARNHLSGAGGQDPAGQANSGRKPS
ncbi:hypothetical protein GCM10008966_23980 [Rhodovulum strictum]